MLFCHWEAPEFMAYVLEKLPKVREYQNDKEMELWHQAKNIYNSF